MPIPSSIPSSSEFSTSTRKMDGYGEVCLLGDGFDPSGAVRMREDEYDSRSGSDNIDGALSGDDQDANDEQQPKGKKYHRHTPHQIQELEIFFKECPHPDDKQRSELSRRLCLETKQVKFWFQNRRTQMKTQIERHENAILKQENDKLRAENSVMKDAIANPTCNTCGGPSIPGHLSFEEHHLRIENARLREELHRLYTVTNKFLGWPVSSPFGNQGSSPSSDSCLELSVGRSGIGRSSTVSDSMGLGNGHFGAGPAMPISKPEIGVSGNDIPLDRTIYVDFALAAMNELVEMAQTDAPLWIRSRDGGSRETLNLDEYSRTFPSSAGMKHINWTTEATRDSTMVIINSLALVETLMDANRWAEMFPCLIARATTIDVITSGMCGTRNGALQLMHAELRVLSPLVPVRTLKFLRFCRQHADGLWAVVDVSIGEGSDSNTFLGCRRLPSGCVVEDMPNGFSKVTWVEHTEYDETVIHQLYRQLISSGVGFGSQRWLANLQRQCECLAILMSSTIPTEDPAGISPGGRRSMLKLSQRMVDKFCSGLCSSSLHKWDKLVVGNISEDVKVMARKSINEPGEPPGIVLSAATSVWMPVTQQRLFAFLQDDRLRSEWDILSNSRPMLEMVRISKGQDADNRVSLLRANPMNANESTMFILQETWTDISGSLVVYAPVDTASVSLMMRGGDSAYVSLLPSGFAILPNATNNDKDASMKSGMNSGHDNGCLLTVAFQILVNNLPTAKLTVESVETVNNLIFCTIRKIKTALQVS
ncbi:homeobox-leucine zipper protein ANTHOCYANINLESS 2-like isoform X1 [Cucurbita pepo subsp. pepo]|uniref:homeobox-leucine zipper protein ANTHOCYANINLESS 2-like isoform X1 n=2 Tax=Cucurbita pepo subsp. pepo TaxID=3664 RepID=UPI000C9D84E7|nr:homeobox-leucine zipper protein ANTHOCYANINLESS 2-like isoform X1 [Cucurbita pepo subsp. pepo]